MKTYSMNDYLYFRLTPSGVKIWEAENKKLKRKFPDYERSIPYLKNDWIRKQLWEVFQLFGPHVGVGSDVCIFDITFECPKELLEEVNE